MQIKTRGSIQQSRVQIKYVTDYPDPFNQAVNSKELAHTFCLTVRSPFKIELTPRNSMVYAPGAAHIIGPHPSGISINLGLKLLVPEGYGILNTAIGIKHRDYIVPTPLDYYTVLFKPAPNQHMLINKGDDLMRLYLLKYEEIIFDYHEFPEKTI